MVGERVHHVSAEVALQEGGGGGGRLFHLGQVRAVHAAPHTRPAPRPAPCPAHPALTALVEIQRTGSAAIHVDVDFALTSPEI